jgi:hypothetical protein
VQSANGFFGRVGHRKVRACSWFRHASDFGPVD